MYSILKNLKKYKALICTMIGEKSPKLIYVRRHEYEDIKTDDRKSITDCYGDTHDIYEIIRELPATEPVITNYTETKNLIMASFQNIGYKLHIVIKKPEKGICQDYKLTDAEIEFTDQRNGLPYADLKSPAAHLRIKLPASLTVYKGSEKSLMKLASRALKCLMPLQDILYTANESEIDRLRSKFVNMKLYQMEENHENSNNGAPS